MSSATVGTSPRRLARIAGALYLVNIVGGFFAIGIVPLLLIGPDPAATAQNIQAHEFLYRAGIAAHVLVVLTNIPLAVIFYDLFKVVNRRIALLDVAFILVATAIEAAGLVSQFTPLILLGSGIYRGDLSAGQLDALAYLPLQVSDADYIIHTVFFGFDILCMAYLVMKSLFLPHVLAILLVVDGVGYLLYSFGSILAPEFAAQLVPWIQLPALLGEGALCLWLLLKGLDLQQWNNQARPAAPAVLSPSKVLR
jgi:hypothetical protein